MSKKVIETVSEHCKHEDCIYRRSLPGNRTELCFYAAVEHERRGCKISECTRYKRGKPRRPRIDVNVEIWWEYDKSDDNI